jgi:predicted DCC family thiol-disulfide oxidoreductase YuxK
MLDVIYDGRCGFCVRSLNVCRALDLRSAFRYHDATARQQVLTAFPELASADFENAMFVVAPDRRVARGFFAFRRMLWESPLMWPLLLPFYVPGSGWIGPRVYAWVARNRRTLGRESDVCERPPTPPSSRNPRD